MAVKIRLKRVGARNHPVFRIVVADSRSPRDGKCIEELGTYHPQKGGQNFNLDLERAQYWVERGAQPSDTVSSFIKKARKAAAAGPAAETTPPVPAAQTAPAATTTPTPTPAPAPTPAPTPAPAKTEATPAPPAATEAPAAPKPETN